MTLQQHEQQPGSMSRSRRTNNRRRLLLGTVLSLFVLVSAAAAAPACDLSGRYFGPGGDLYQLTATSNPLVFNASLVQAANTPWKTGVFSVGDASCQSVTARYDCGAVRVGSITQQQAPLYRVLLTFNDTTSWRSPSAPLLDVHIVAHTHDDTSWLKTTDEYAEGLNDTIYPSSTRTILSSVVSALAVNPERRFIYVEMAFFHRWWQEQPAFLQNLTRDLVRRGQLEFISAGWCMSDEGTPSFVDMVNQNTLGLEFVEREFGAAARPRVAWQIDPFGHTRSFAKMSLDLGHDMLVVGRIDYQDKEQRTAANTLETLWRPSQSQPDAQLFVHVLDAIQFYGFPPGFDFEDGDEPIVDNPASEGYNAETRAQEFARFVRLKAGEFRTPSLMVLFGTDFHFQNAIKNFDNIDRLIGYINTHAERFGMVLRYSTPSRYMDAVNAYNLTWPVKREDFESYPIGPNQFLVGYYTSRPGYKGMIRMASGWQKATETAAALARLLRPAVADWAAVTAGAGVLQRAMGLAQHHDAISGTTREHVNDDNRLLLANGTTAALAATAAVLEGLAGSQLQGPVVACPLLNESRCDALHSRLAAGQRVAVALVNGLAREWGVTNNTAASPATQLGGLVRLPIPSACAGAGLAVHGPDGQPVAFEVLPAIEPPLRRRVEAGQQPMSDLVFAATLPPSGIRTFTITPGSGMTRNGANNIAAETLQAAASTPDMITLSNGLVTATISADGQLRQLVQHSPAGGPDISIPVNSSLYYYLASTGGDQGSGSGQYILQVDNATRMAFSNTPTVTVVNGSLVQEVRVVYIPQAISAVFRLRRHSRALEIEYRLGPIPVADGVSKEVMAGYSSDLASDGVWYTDSNTQEMQRRVRNHRDSFNFTCTSPTGIPCNMFPVAAMAWLEDQTQLQTQPQRRRLSVLVDRAEACASLEDGRLDLLVHRRLVAGSHRWTGELLNDTARVFVRHWLLAEPGSQDGGLGPGSPSLARLAASEAAFPPLPFFAGAPSISGGSSSSNSGSSSSSSSSSNGSSFEFAPLLEALPPNVQLTNIQLQEHNASRVVLRLSHLFAAGEHPEWSAPQTVDLRKHFPASLLAVLGQGQETVLGANAALADVAPKRLVWRAEEVVEEEDPGVAYASGRLRQEGTAVGRSGPLGAGDNWTITLQPMQTRTFVFSTHSSVHGQ